MTDVSDNGEWSAWSKHVLLELERLNKGMEKIEAASNNDLKEINNRITALNFTFMSKIQEVKDDVLTLKVKASIWGGIAGTVISLILSLIGKKW